jgi:hypothetical protein
MAVEPPLARAWVVARSTVRTRSAVSAGSCNGLAQANGPQWSLACQRACLAVVLHHAWCRSAQRGLALFTPPDRLAVSQVETRRSDMVRLSVAGPSQWYEGSKNPPALVWS